MCDRPGLLIPSDDCFSHLSMKVAAECSIRPIWSTCEKGFKSPAQAQISLSVGSVTPPLSLQCFSLVTLLLCGQLFGLAAVCVAVNPSLSFCILPHIFHCPELASDRWMGGIGVFIHICACLQAHLLSQCTSAVDVKGWDVLEVWWTTMPGLMQHLNWKRKVPEESNVTAKEKQENPLNNLTYVTSEAQKQVSI